MKFLILLALSIVVWLVLGYLIPYWGIMVAIAVLAAYINLGPLPSFLATGVGVAGVWLFLPLYWWMTTETDLPFRMAEIMGLHNSAYLLGITGIIGFFLGAFSGLTGSLLRQIFTRESHY